MSLHHNMTSRSYVVAVNHCTVYHGVLSSLRLILFFFYIDSLLKQIHVQISAFLQKLASTKKKCTNLRLFPKSLTGLSPKSIGLKFLVCKKKIFVSFRERKKISDRHMLAAIRKTTFLHVFS